MRRLFINWRLRYYCQRLCMTSWEKLDYAAGIDWFLWNKIMHHTSKSYIVMISVSNSRKRHSKQWTKRMALVKSKYIGNCNIRVAMISETAFKATSYTLKSEGTLLLMSWRSIYRIIVLAYLTQYVKRLKFPYRYTKPYHKYVL